MGMKFRNPSPTTVEKISMVLNENNPGISLNKNNVGLSYHFAIERVAKDVIGVRKIGIKGNYADPFTKPFVSNKFHGIYHK